MSAGGLPRCDMRSQIAWLRGRGRRHRRGRSADAGRAGCDIVILPGAAAVVGYAVCGLDVGRAASLATVKKAQELEVLGNITFLERPARPDTVRSSMRAALRARMRQYEMRHRQEMLMRVNADLEQVCLFREPRSSGADPQRSHLQRNSFHAIRRACWSKRHRFLSNVTAAADAYADAGSRSAFLYAGRQHYG